MYLKEIKISGFKSFADKINLTLDNDITCIVGPNGSGKSNIVDAVKWVLGEQSVKTLRGDSNMTDVIFSGSKSRKPLNLASVTLIFDNSDTYLKVPYTEISITRKVYRSGENEYFINNEKCRLKDINDLFLDSGMGRYAFNIISQGEVANIINSTPYERRTLFEEAAGVLKYKKRKEEALRKLDKTNQNMVRIKDIITELNDQIEPLRAQKDAALKYLDFEEKLRNVEIALIVSDLEKLNNNYHNYKNKIEQLEETLAKEMTVSTNLDIDLDKTKNEISVLNEEIANDNKELLELTRNLEKINGEMNILKERSKYESNDLKVHENITRLKENKYIINNKLLSIKNDLEIITNKLTSLQTTYQEKENSLQDYLTEKTALEQSISTKNKSLTDLEYKIKYLTNYIEQGSSLNPNVKKVLSNPKLTGIHNTIANLIEVEDSYSLALSVSLGGAKDYVVVDSPKVAKQAINYLKENNLGRVTFFPLDVIKPRYIENSILSILTNNPGFIGVLSSLIKYDSKYENIIKNQLGNVILTDNIDTANEISKIINNRYKIVTLQGEVINVGGSITGGKIKTSSIITEKHELRKYLHDQELLKNNLNDNKQQLDKLLATIQTKQNELFDLEKAKLLLEEERELKNQSYEQEKTSLQEINQELNNLDSLENNTIDKEQERLMAKYYELKAQKEAKEKQSAVTLANKEQKEAFLEEQEASYKLKNSHIHKLEEELKEYEIINSKDSVKMDNLLNTLSESYQMTFEKAKANYILEIEEDIARKNVNTYRRELKSLGPVNVGAIEEFDRINTRYEFLKKQKDDLEEASVTLLKIIDELDEVMKEEFSKTFKNIEIEFDKVFKELFKGGSAKLKLTDENDLLQTGIEINVTPPGKKLSSISLLSGGEKTLTAISLLFAILNIKKIPFCLFDEVEAALDEANVARVGAYFSKYIGKTQLIIITHKKKTMEYAKTLYGITMQESGVSKLVSVKLVE